MDARAVQAREAHRLSRESDNTSRVHRERRNALVRSLHDDDWSYNQIARAVGISKELVAVIIRGNKPDI